MALPAPAPQRTALVTGASAGIGIEIARQLASRGQGLTLVARREDRLRSLADELSSRHSVRVEVASADLTDIDARAALADTVAERGLEVSILVNNAGLSTMGPVAHSDPGAEVRMIRTDVEAVADLCSRFVPAMAERRSGAVLNVASTAAFQPLPGQAGYGASKAFVLSYSQAMRAELAGKGVGVTVLCPGPVETEFAEVMGLGDEAASKSLPKVMWLSASEVARQAVEGLDAGKGVVIPGTVNNVAARASWFFPRTLLLPVLARQHPALRDT